MREGKYHGLDKRMSKQIRDDLLKDGITEYPAVCKNYQAIPVLSGDDLSSHACNHV